MLLVPGMWKLTTDTVHQVFDPPTVQTAKP
jgi:hypothetical protein